MTARKHSDGCTTYALYRGKSFSFHPCRCTYIISVKRMQSCILLFVEHFSRYELQSALNTADKMKIKEVGFMHQLDHR